MNILLWTSSIPKMVPFCYENPVVLTKESPKKIRKNDDKHIPPACNVPGPHKNEVGLGFWVEWGACQQLDSPSLSPLWAAILPSPPDDEPNICKYGEASWLEVLWKLTPSTFLVPPRYTHRSGHLSRPDWGMMKSLKDLENEKHYQTSIPGIW